MAVNIQNVAGRLILGEGPHWSGRDHALYFVSIMERTIHKYSLATGLHTKTKLDIAENMVNHILPVEGTVDQFLVNSNQDLLVIRWDGKDNSTVEVVKKIATLNEGEGPFMINDAKADPRGRIYTGTMKVGKGSSLEDMERHTGNLYKLDRGIPEKLDVVSLPNGLAWDLNEKAFYYVDTLERDIRRYDYDVETGKISNKTYIFDFKKNNITGYPDGITIDTDGNLWVAVFDGSAVLNIDPRTGALLRKLEMPVEQVASVTFGGPDLDVLYVTTGAMEQNLKEGEQLQPLAGCVFAITGLGVKGHPNLDVKI